MNSVAQLITVILLFVLVLVLTYLTTRFIGSYQKTRNTGLNVEVIESSRISPTQFIQIVRIGKRYYALACGKDTVTRIDEIPEADLQLTRVSGSGEGGNFQALLESMQKRTKRQGKDGNHETK